MSEIIWIPASVPSDFQRSKLQVPGPPGEDAKYNSPPTFVRSSMPAAVDAATRVVPPGVPSLFQISGCPELEFTKYAVPSTSTNSIERGSYERGRDTTEICCVPSL